MDDEAKAAEAALAIETTDQVVGNFDALQCNGEDEFARVKDERDIVVHAFQLSKFRHLFLDIDIREAVVAEDAELPAEAEIDTRRLDISIFKRIHDQPAGADLFADRVVAQDHGSNKQQATCNKISL